MPTRSTLPPLLWEPAPPAIESQHASAQGAADLAESALWRYHLRYWHEHRAQDEVIITVSFNDLPPSGAAVATHGAPPGVDYRLTARLDFSDDGESIEAMRLTREADDAMPAGCWPCVDYRSSDGGIVDLGQGAGEGATRTYAFDPPAPWTPQSIGLSWSGLDVAGLQTARASLTAVRNRGLGDESTSDVVYRTRTIQAPDVVKPHNRWPQEFRFSDLGDTLGAALDATFVALFGERRTGQQVALKLAYGYALLPDAEPDAAPMAYLPVGLWTVQRITAETSAQVAAFLAEWKSANDPPTARGEWLISLTQFPQIDTAATPPLLELDRLVYRIAHVQPVAFG